MEDVILDPLQAEAVDACCDISLRIVGVTGAAGTGKTTLLKKTYERLTEHGYRVALCSPTGKAAKRIYQATGIEAQTMHRLLEYTHPGDPDPKTGKALGCSIPRRTRQEPLDYDVILADEYAMVNEELNRSLFDAVPSGGVVRCFGDDEQLHPIEEGDYKSDQPKQPSPFQRLLKGDKFKVVRLERVFRQGADSGILYNCGLILKGRSPSKNDQWSMQVTDASIDALRNYVLENEEAGHSFAEIQNQIIVPQNKSGVGTLALNQMLQGLFHNELEPSMKLDRKSWVIGADGVKGGQIRVFKGEKVIITSNIYDLMVFNGETGVILDMEQETGEILIDFGDREQTIPPVLQVQNRHGGLSVIDPRKDIDLAYAITTHKSQGSEFERVVYILNRSNHFMISRRNFYTAASRAREHVHLITDQRGLWRALSNRD